jgi:pyruvate dehydrogenase E1 component beta subunit
MPTQILMPALSPTMTEGNLAKWLKKEGDKVKAGDVIAEIETDKATMEVEAVDEGILGKILISEGTQGVAVNTPIAVLVEEGEEVGDVSAMTDIPCVPQSKPESAAATGMSTARQTEGKIIENRDILYAQGHVLEPPPFDESELHGNAGDDGARSAARCDGGGNAHG